MTLARVARCSLAALAVAFSGCASTTNSPASDAGSDAPPGDAGTNACTMHTYREVSIPLRDGKSLAAFVRAPEDPSCKLPVVLVQTPYGKENAKALWFESSSRQPLFESKDYAFVVVDMRGFFGSAAARTTSLTPAEDGYDTVEWVAAQPWSTGAVGTWGVSALGVQQYQTASAAPPHLKAAVPIFCQPNSTYDLYYPGGVLRREYADFLSTYFGSAGAVLQYPYDGPAWTYAASLVKVSAMAVPMLVVAGWYDLNPKGSFGAFAQLAASSPAGGDARLLVGPWIHNATGGETAQGRALDDEEKLYVDRDRKIQVDSLAFFDLHVRGVSASPAASWAKVRFLGGGESSGEESVSSWPPASQARTLYLTASGALAEAAPPTGSLAFPYDPNDPSPTLGGGTLLGPLHHGPTSQAPVLARADQASFASQPLTQSLRIAGTIAVTLDVSHTGVDTDVAVRLTDVDASGTHRVIGEGIRRLTLLANARTPTPVPAGRRVTVPVPLMGDLAYTFAAGHRVGLIVSNANYPRFDRNPNNGETFLVASGPAPQRITTTLFTDGASRIVLPVRP